VADYLVISPGSGEQLVVRGSALAFKATGATTDGAFSLHERHIPAGGKRPPPHVHPDRAEAFWVLDGEAEFELDGDRVSARAGSFILVPGGVAHTFGASATTAARVLVLHAPALDGYFRELADLWSQDAPPDRDSELDLMRKHGMRPV
jgi:mannose-6-phosphate isomerase-like protein (cupin superfamily)